MDKDFQFDKYVSDLCWKEIEHLPLCQNFFWKNV